MMILKAVEYALEWGGNSDANEEPRNPDFYSGEASLYDCTNFASQCLYAGGFVQSDAWCMKKTDLNFIEGETVALLQNKHYDDSWMWSTAWINAEAHYSYFSANHSQFAFVITSLEELQELINQHYIRSGDLLYFEKADGVHHTTIITEVTDNDIFLGSHTNWYTHKSFSDNYDNYIDNDYIAFCVICLDDIIV